MGTPLDGSGVCRAGLPSMSLLHVRVVSPADLRDEVEAILRGQRGATNLVVLPGAAREARHVARRQVLANITVISIAVGLVSAVAGLCPLPTSIYRWLFALTVGGGVGGLVAACVIGAQTLAAEVDAARLDELDRFAERARQDAERAQQDAERAQRDAERAQKDEARRDPGPANSPGAGGGK